MMSSPDAHSETVSILSTFEQSDSHTSIHSYSSALDDQQRAQATESEMVRSYARSRKRHSETDSHSDCTTSGGFQAVL